MKPYVICCEPRIVLFGYATKAELAKKEPTLRRSRMLVYWDTSTKGVLGAAANGPSSKCRVTPAVPEHKIKTKIECILSVSPEAAEKWEAEPWA